MGPEPPDRKQMGTSALVGESAATERLRVQVRRIGPHFRTALITGERGVRKGEVARELHATSPVGTKRFAVCDAERMEQMAQGSGQDATRSRAAVQTLVGEARGGTIFFREIGQFSAAAQRMLLGMLEELRGEGIRVVASVSDDLRALIAAGVLRAEIPERIGTIEIAVAPLRERVEDIRALGARLLEEEAAKSGGEVAKISEEALLELKARDWPGNERELESVLRMAALASGGGMIEVRHLPRATRGGAAAAKTEDGLAGLMKLQAVVDAHVQEVLRRCEGNKLKAAEVLGISRSTLYRMLDAVAEGGASGSRPDSER